LDGKEVRYDERVFGRDENDQGSGVAVLLKLAKFLVKIPLGPFVLKYCESLFSSPK